MSFTRKAILAPVAIMLALSLTPALTACSGNPIQGIIKDATGGNVDMGGTTVPADFPSEVPLAQGQVISVFTVGSLDKGKVWNIGIKVAGASSAGDISSQLTEAGFTILGGNVSSKEGAANIFTKDPYSVLVVVAKDDKGNFLANYSVTYTKPGS